MYIKIQEGKQVKAICSNNSNTFICQSSTQFLGPKTWNNFSNFANL